MKETISVWVITSSYNDYDQHGEYFIEVMAEKPTLEYLQSLLGIGRDTAEHLLRGGGRMSSEYCWFYLYEYKLIKNSN